MKRKFRECTKFRREMVEPWRKESSENIQSLEQKCLNHGEKKVRELNGMDGYKDSNKRVNASWRREKVREL